MEGVDEMGTAPGRLKGFPKQLHPRFPGGFPGFALIASFTGAGYIFPAMFAAPVTRYDVVQGQLTTLFSAILAGVTVPGEYPLAGQLGVGPRSLDQV